SPFELIDRFHQTDIAFLNQIKKLQASICIFLGYRNHKTKISLNQFLLCFVSLLLACNYGIQRSLELNGRDVPFVFAVREPVFCIAQIPFQLALVLVPFLAVDCLASASYRVLSVPGVQYRFPDNRYEPAVLLGSEVEVPDLAADFDSSPSELSTKAGQL